jgi:hypothetical protein
MRRTKATKTGPNVVRLAVSNPILTYDQCRGQDFEAVPQFLDHEKALEIHAKRWSFLDSMTRVSVLTLGKSKPELIAMAAGDRDFTVSLAKDLREGIEEAKLMLSLIEGASARLMIALHNAFPDDESA